MFLSILSVHIQSGLQANTFIYNARYCKSRD